MPSLSRPPERVLVTGANGFVGKHLIAVAAERWPSARLIRLTNTADTGPGFVGVDLLDHDAIEAAIADARPDVVIHLAAQASVARGAQDAGETWAVNVSGSLNLASVIARLTPDSTVLFVSSAEVYGASFLAGPVDEAATLLPINAYARSKAIAERIFSDVLPTNTRLLVARPFNHTGPGQSEEFVLPSFVAQVARIEAEAQPPQLAVGNLDVARDFLDVRDIIEAYLLLIEAALSLPRRFVCNIASETVEPLRAHVETLRGLARRDFEVVVDPARLRRVDLPLAAGDARLLRAVTGWVPRYNMQTTLESMLHTARNKVWRTREDSNL